MHRFNILSANLELAICLTYNHIDFFLLTYSNHEQEGISIIIPVYNDRDELKLCLKSLSELKMELPCEVIIVDNGSTESIKDVVDKYNFTYCIEKKEGSYAARNTGVKQANYDYICFVDADCTFDNDWPKELITLIKSDEVFYYAGNIEVLTGNNSSCIEWFEHCFAFNQAKNVQNKVSVTAHLLIHREIFCEFGGFDEEYLSGGDKYFTSRVSKKYALKFAKSLVVYHPSRSLKELIKKDIRVMGGKYVQKLKGKNFLYKNLYAFGYSLLLFFQIPGKIKGKKRKFCLTSIFCLKTIVKFFTVLSINFGLTQPQRK